MHSVSLLSRWRVLMSLGVVLTLIVSISVIALMHSPKAKADANYQWHQLGIGGGGFVTGIAIHPTTPGLVYVRTDVGGAYRLGPNDTWQQLIVNGAVPNPTATDYNVESIAVSKSNDQTLYLAVGNDLSNANGRILKSTDQGRTFTDNGQRWEIGGNQDYRTGGERLAVDPNNDNIVYFGSRTAGLWVTTDGGQQWNQISTSTIPVGSNDKGAAAGVSFVLFDPNSGTSNGKTNRIYVGVAGAGVYTTTNGGDSWSNSVNFTGTSIPYSADVASDGTLYVGTIDTESNGVVERYTPSSNSWQNISPVTGGNYYEVAADPLNAQRVVVSPGGVTSGNLWRSTNQGGNWTTLDVAVSSPTIPWVTNTDESNYLSAGKLTFDPHVNDKLWFPEGIGLWYSSDNTGSTVTFQFYSKGIEETVTSDLIAPPGGQPISTIYDRQGFYHSNVNSYPNAPLIDQAFWGGTSVDYSGNHPQNVVTIQAKNNYYPSLTGRGASSSNGGQSWNLFPNLPTDNIGGNIAISANDPNDLVWLPSTGSFGQGKNPYYSTDGGQSWNASGGVNSPNAHWLFWWGQKRALTSDKSNGNFYLITLDNNGTFYTSTDGGRTFNQAANSPPCSQNDNCHVYGQIHSAPGFANNVWSSGGNDGLWYSTDAGASAWQKVSGVQVAESFGFGKAFDGYSYPAIYLYGKANNDGNFGIYRSIDQGSTWTRISDGPLGIYDQVNVVNGDMNIAGRVYVGFTGNGFAYGDDQGSLPATATTTAATATPTVSSGGGTVTLGATDDRDDFSTDTATGTAINASEWQTGYFKFGLSSVSGSVNKAVLRLYRVSNNVGSVTATAYSTNDDSWTQNSTSFPAVQSSVGSATSPGVGWVEIDVTSLVQQQLAGDKTALFAIKTDNGSWTSFNSRENATNQPQLVINP